MQIASLTQCRLVLRPTYTVCRCSNQFPVAYPLPDRDLTFPDVFPASAILLMFGGDIPFPFSRQETMKIPTSIVALAAIFTPLIANSTDPVEVPGTPRDSIVLSEATDLAFDRSGRFVTTETRPDGSIISHHNGSLQNVTVARVGPEGQIETFCSTDKERAVDWMARSHRRPHHEFPAEEK